MEVVERLRIIDWEKLSELCCMHLSFALDLHDDEFAALLNAKSEFKANKKNYFSRKQKEKPSPDAMPLSQESISRIYQIIEFIGRDININHEGLFRKTGSLLRQQELKTLLNAGAIIDFSLEHYTIDDCACVMKNFLAELPEPLLTEAHYTAHCQIAGMMRDDMTIEQKKHAFQQQIKSLRLLLLLLPQDNYCLLKYLLMLLSQVKIAHHKNLMNSYNLATIFAPQVLCPRKFTPEQMKGNFVVMVKAVSFMIENAHLLFEPPVELLQDISIYLNSLPLHGSPSTPKTEAVKTAVAFCERTNVDELDSVDYTQKALAELQTYIHQLPNSARKRKLVKKLRSEKSNDTSENRRKHVRSKSVGDAIKKHLWKNSNRNKEGFHKDYRHASYDMLATDSSSEQTTEFKAKSVEALNLDRPSVSNKNGLVAKNWLRASKKIKSWQS